MRLLVLLTLLALLAGCDSSELHDCTTDFRSITVEVVDADGEPVSGLNTETINTRTGTRVQSRPLDSGTSNVYAVLTDLQEIVTREREPITFVAFNDRVRATGGFEIGFDGCHINKLSGPNRIVAEEIVAGS